MTDTLPPPDAAPPAGSGPQADEANMPDGQMLRVMGYTKKTAARLLANGKSKKYLNTLITCKVAMVHGCNSMDQVMALQKGALKTSKDPSVDARTRVAAMAVGVQAGMTWARMTEAMISTARNLDAPEGEGNQPAIKLTQHNTFGFPPVSDGRERRASNPDKIGGSTVTDVPSEVKSA